MFIKRKKTWIIQAANVTVLLCALVGQLPFSSAWSQSEETFMLNLNNVDIRSLIETVSRRTGKNFIVDPRVNANVTVVSAEPVDASGLYELFQSVLAVHGFATVTSGSFTKIVPLTVAVQSAVPVVIDETSQGDRLVSVVIPIRYASAQEVAEAIRPLVTVQGSVSAEVNSNSLIVTDLSLNIAGLKRVIRQLDRF